MNEKQREIRQQIEALKPGIRELAKANDGKGTRIHVRCYRKPYITARSQFQGSEEDYQRLLEAADLLEQEIQLAVKRQRFGKPTTPWRAWAGSQPRGSTGLVPVSFRETHGRENDPSLGVITKHDRMLATAIIEELRITEPDAEKYRGFSNTSAYIEDAGEHFVVMSLVVSANEEARRRQEYEDYVAEEAAKEVPA